MSSASAEAYDVCDLAKMHMLSAAHEMKNKEVLELIVNRRVCVDAFDDDRVTVLQIAAATGNVSLVTCLLEEGADIDACNQVGMTAFHQACREGHLKVVEILLQRGANIHSVTHLGASALTLAAGGGHSEVVKKLINLHVKTTGSEGYAPTALIAAAFRGNAVTLSTLVKLGKATVNEVCERLYNLSPLTCAVMCSSRPMISCLLEMDADPTHIALRNKSAFELAQYQKRSEVLEMFREHNVKKNIKTETKDIRQLIIDGDIVKLKLAVQRRELSPDGTPSILFATLFGNISTLRRLIEWQESVEGEDQKTRLDSLMAAALLRDSQSCEFLLSMGASSCEMNNEGSCAWDLYHSSTEEVDEVLRSSLSVFSSRRNSVMRYSGNHSSLSKWLSSGKQKLALIQDKDEGTASIRMRSWYEGRMKSWTMIGRNHKKLVLTEEVLKGKKEMTKRRERTLNRYMEVARSMVEECNSFSFTSFYDLYNKEIEQRNTEGMNILPKGEIDMAVYLSNLYGYKGMNRDSSSAFAAHNRANLSSLRSNRCSDLNARVRRTETTPGGTVRTTPRMLKKSRESVVSMEENRSSARSLLMTSNTSLLTPLEESTSTLTSIPYSIRSSSTPQLAITPRSHFISSSFDNCVWDRMENRGLSRLREILIQQEVNANQFVNEFDERNFREMGITDSSDIIALISLQRSFR